ncbi:AAA family ATPase [Mycolicibacterium sp. Dal123E01]|uniref:AAA family ATPase n=1 Tax=Mycolicibacterium sp. Dal123E01 TaxID=3457578 RepID=UPI00403EBF0E
MRIAITGTHSVGKSTLVRDFHAAHPEFQIEDEPYRQLAAQGERIHFAERASQRCNTLMTRHAIDRIKLMRELRPDIDVICDRSCLDFIPYSEYALAMGGEEGVAENLRRRTVEVRADMQEKADLKFTSDITAAYIDELWTAVIDSEALDSYDLIVFVPLTGDPAIDPVTEDDGIRSVETFYRNWIDRAFKRLYRDELPRRAPLTCGFAEIVGDRQDRVRALEEIVDEAQKFK